MSTESLGHDRQRLREITRRVADLKGRAALVLYELGVLLTEVADHHLYRAGDYATFEDYLDAEVQLSRATSYKAMRVARHFNAGMVERYGIEKLDAGVRYLELSKQEERPGDLVAAHLRLRGEDGRFVSVPFHEASYRQVREAARLLQERRNAPAHSTRERTARVALAVRDAIPGAQVSVRRSAHGMSTLGFRGIPMDALLPFARALLAAAEAFETEK